MCSVVSEMKTPKIPNMAKFEFCKVPCGKKNETGNDQEIVLTKKQFF